MLDEVRAAVAEIGAGYADTRVNYFRVEVTPGEGNQYVLTGAVLDAATYAALANGLLDRFPDLCFDGAAVQVLRSPTPEIVAVATNLAGLHAGPSRLAEQVSQLLNGWPLEVLRTEGSWSLVRQLDGYLGWVYRPYLVGPAAVDPTHVVAAPVCMLYDGADAGAPVVTRILGGTAVAVSAIRGGWARVTLAGDLAGWAIGDDLRALAALPIDPTARRRQIVADAFRFIGVPYQWGGCTANGIDCSGFAQLLHRLSGVNLPRDADMQFAVGEPVDAAYQPGDLLFFREGGDPSAHISHVGVSLGGWQMIHSSGAHNGVYVDDIQQTPHLKASFAGARTFLGV